jgi:protein SCO1/2
MYIDGPKKVIIIMTMLLLYTTSISIGQVIKDDDPALKGIDVLEHPGDTIPLDIALTNDKGEAVTLDKYFSDGKPVVLIMAYYTCPMLCNLVLNGVVEAARDMSLTPGRDYRLLTVSIDPTETFDLAAAKKKNYVNSLGRPEAVEGWTFFVADGNQSRRLADAIGFMYYYDDEHQQYAHPALITILTGSGVISRYLYGIEFKERDLKLALMEASEEKIGNTFDRVLLYCYHYDPDAGGYTVLAGNVMKVGGILTLAGLAVFLGIFWLWEWRRRSIRAKDTKGQ